MKSVSVLPNSPSPIKCDIIFLCYVCSDAARIRVPSPPRLYFTFFASGTEEHTASFCFLWSISSVLLSQKKRILLLWRSRWRSGPSATAWLPSTHAASPSRSPSSMPNSGQLSSMAKKNTFKTLNGIFFYDHLLFRNPFIINNLQAQFEIQDRRKVYKWVGFEVFNHTVEYLDHKVNYKHCFGPLDHKFDLIHGFRPYKVIIILSLIIQYVKF